MFESIQALFAQNPLIAGGAGVAVMGWLLMQARSIPAKIWAVTKNQFSTSLTIYSEESIFRRVDVWLAKHPGAKKSRRFNVAIWHNHEIDDDDFSLTPGPGFHLLRQGARFFIVHRNIEDTKEGEGGGYSQRRRQTLTISTLGRSPAPMVELLERIKTAEKDTTTIPVYIWNGFDFRLVERRRKRPLDTIYMDAAQKAAIVGDLSTFHGKRAWYGERAIPWRRGYMLNGPPGTGKTSLIFALASLNDKPIYIINPTSVENDNNLQAAFNSAGNGYVVMEDLDSLKVAGDREKREEIGGAENAGAETNKAGITLSGLLNALDGIGSREGRVVFITSNHADVFDPALIRPGRVDMHLHLGHIGRTEATAMFSKFFPDEDPRPFLEQHEGSFPIATSALQNLLLTRSASSLQKETTHGERQPAVRPDDRGTQAADQRAA